MSFDLLQKEFDKFEAQFEVLNSMFKELFGIDALELIAYRERYGEFACTMLMDSKLKARAAESNPFLAGIKEMACDADFMNSLDSELRRQVATALRCAPN